MRIGIMQPYFFPYLGHFALISHVDQWFVFDITQYTPKTWMNRNRVLHPQVGWNYIGVPLVNSSISLRTHEASILDLGLAHKSVLGKISHYRKKAPYSKQVEALIDRSFSEVNDNSLVSLNVAGLKAICSYIGVPFSYKICSELNLDLPASLSAGLWAPTICRTIGAEEYLNPIAGRHLFDASIFEANNIRLKLLDYTTFRYTVGRFQFEPDLSIIDVLMWCSPEQTRQALFTNSIVTDGFQLS